MTSPLTSMVITAAPSLPLIPTMTTSPSLQKIPRGLHPVYVGKSHQHYVISSDITSLTPAILCAREPVQRTGFNHSGVQGHTVRAHALDAWEGRPTSGVFGPKGSFGMPGFGKGIIRGGGMVLLIVAMVGWAISLVLEAVLGYWDSIMVGVRVSSPGYGGPSKSYSKGIRPKKKSYSKGRIKLPTVLCNEHGLC